VFEPHTEIIRKGKAAKPTEFGKMVKIQEAERYVHVFDEIAVAGRHSARSVSIAAVTPKMTIVRMIVARFELMPATPILPKNAVSPANKAEPSAKNTQL
jgi:hypothetical protein